MLLVNDIHASSHTISWASVNNFPSFVFFLTSHIDVDNIGIGIPNWLCTVLFLFYNVGAKPDDAVAVDKLSAVLKAA